MLSYKIFVNDEIFISNDDLFTAGQIAFFHIKIYRRLIAEKIFYYFSNEYIIFLWFHLIINMIIYQCLSDRNCFLIAQ